MYLHFCMSTYTHNEYILVNTKNIYIDQRSLWTINFYRTFTITNPRIKNRITLKITSKIEPFKIS